MPDHGIAEGVVLPLRLCVRGLGSCAPGRDVQDGQGVQFDDFLYVQEHMNGRCRKWLIKSENCDGST